MNNAHIEQKLVESGFSPKEISALRRAAESDGHPYIWLLSQLKKRFFGSCALLVIFVGIWFHTAFTGNRDELVSYSLAMIIVAGIIYVFTPMKTAFKAYRFLKKNHF